MALFVIICSSVAVFAAADYVPVCGDVDCSYTIHEMHCTAVGHTGYYCTKDGKTSCVHQNCP